MAQTTETRKIVIRVEGTATEQIKIIADALGNMNKNTKALANSMGTLTAGTTTFLGGLSIKTLAGFSDEIQSLNNRLLAMSGSQKDATETLDGLTQISRETNQTLAGTAEGYLRMSLAIKDAGVSQKTLLEATKVISNTFRISGATTEEAANATVQLGQAFSLGALRGQDLRSVMSQNVTLTRLLRKEFGNDLLKSAEAGLITTAKIMEILFKNMNDVNKSASVMAATFEQSTAKGIDAFKLKIFEVSRALDAPGIFAKGIQLAIDHMGELVSIGTLLVVTTLPALVVGLGTLAGALGLLNPIALAVAASIGLVAYAFTGSFDISDIIAKIKSAVERLKAFKDETQAFFVELDAKVRINPADRAAAQGLAIELRKSAALHENNANAIEIERAAQIKQAVQNEKDLDAAKRRAADLAKIAGAFGKEQTAEAFLKALNKQYELGAISLEKYNQKVLEYNLLKTKQKFLNGKEDLGRKNDEDRKVAVFRLNQEFKNGKVSLDQYAQGLNAIKAANLKEDLEAGRISLNEFNSKLASVSTEFSAGGAFRAGLTDYLTSIGTTTQSVAKVITDAFKGLEDVFLDFVKNGKFNFDKFTEAVLDDLTRIIIRASIIQPLAGALLGAFNSPTTSTAGVRSGDTRGGPQSLSAHGNIFNHGLKRFAMGGIVDQPTIFKYGKGGSIGLMGERGPEAILPLKRGSGGDLGVAASITPVNINIINQSGSEIQQTEKTGPSGEKTIEILITSKVREGIASGRFDRAMKTSYGLNRKGS